ncbi:hypothetical protein E2562_007706 [Oryza meyeriana var. granulata]|uniref:Uncharacterized protein n=1 Tax=Oryza meyeriana var. granulata TaxID=110450 RepID=A0A6G1EGI7_9ORYZ|nr:hypothetical protein E2562_007706 [Oryza meyeriana var. granulata]
MAMSSSGSPPAQGVTAQVQARTSTGSREGPQKPMLGLVWLGRRQPGATAAAAMSHRRHQAVKLETLAYRTLLTDWFRRRPPAIG